MEQISYNIVQALLKQPQHVRQLSKILGTNHMTVSRKVQALRKANVIDYRQEGKNNVCFLKKTAEAKITAFQAEYAKLKQALGQYPRLRKILEAVQGNPRIGLAVLFGSYAKGMVKADSDIDLYIETENRNLKKELELLDSRLSIKIGAYDTSQPLIREIAKHHVILKGVERYYDASGFFTETE